MPMRQIRVHSPRKKRNCQLTTNMDHANHNLVLRTVLTQIPKENAIKRRKKRKKKKKKKKTKISMKRRRTKPLFSLFTHLKKISVRCMGSNELTEGRGGIKGKVCKAGI